MSEELFASCKNPNYFETQTLQDFIDLFSRFLVETLTMKKVTPKLTEKMTIKRLNPISKDGIVI
jgi:hypothetical protein